MSADHFSPPWPEAPAASEADLAANEPGVELAIADQPASRAERRRAERKERKLSQLRRKQREMHARVVGRARASRRAVMKAGQRRRRGRASPRRRN